MRPFISLLTAAAFLLHVALGCCAHHAHAAAGRLGTVKATTPLHCCHHEHHQHATPDPAPGSSPDGSPEHPSQPCNEHDCVFALQGQVTIEKDVSFTTLPVLVPAETQQIVEHSATSAVATGVPLGLSVRPHLFHQVFLN